MNMLKRRTVSLLVLLGIATFGFAAVWQGSLPALFSPAASAREKAPAPQPFAPETVVLSDDFESATTFVAANSTVNAWVIGTAAANGGTKGAYISNDAGVTNAYTNTIASINHIYAPITVPAGETAVVLSFDWRTIADYDATADFDYVRVSVRSAVPVAGTMTALAEQIPVTFSGQDNFTRAHVNLPASVATGTPLFLVFTWVDDTSVGTLPGAIDNVLLTSQVPAPLSGVKSIPGDYPSIGAAIANLNANGANTAGGSLTFNVAAGSVFTETPFPLTTSGSSATNRIIFQKSGAGANPKVIAEGGGNFGSPSATSVTSTSDAVIAINTADFLTFDGIDVQSSSVNAVSPFTKVEYGYLLRNNNILANVTTINGAQNNIIQNTAITLDRRKTSPTQTIGIMQSAATGAFGAGSTATSAAQANSGNKYYNLSISNAYAGIYLLGTPAFPDDLTEVGTTSPTSFNSIGAATANDIGNGTVLSWGIRAGSQSNAKLFNNEIRNITNTGTTTIAGIHIDNAGTVTAVSLGTTQVYNNIIHDLNGVNAAAGVISGIRANLTGNAGSVSRIYNNFIYGLNSTSTVTASRRIIGIVVQDAGVGTGATHNVQNNSIRIAPATVGASNTCFEIGGAGATNPVYNVQNNIFANFTGAQAGAAKHYTWVTTSTTSAGTGATSNFNDLYAVNTNGFVGLTGATDRTTLADWQGAVTQDANSISADPLFASTTDLHITGSSPARNTGTTLALITNDIDNQVRPNEAIYEIGADEFYAAPGILQLSSATYSGNEGTTLVATVNRTSGTSGTVGVTYTLTDGTGTGGAACTPGVDYINPGPTALTFLDSVGSQPINVTLCTDAILDPSETFTITLSAPTGGATLGSPTVATATIGDVPPPFAGTFSVGTAQPYTSLTNVGGIFEAINLAGATGNITINITSDLTGETGTVALNEIAGGFTVLIKPSGGPRSITGSSANSIIRLNGADGVRVDGWTAASRDADGIISPEAVGGDAALRELTITNTNTAATAGAVIAIMSGSNGAQNNTIQNVNVRGQDPTQTLVGIHLGGNTVGSAGTDNDGNRVQNCSIQKAFIGIYNVGASVANPNTGTVLTQNDLTGTGANRLRRVGIMFFNENGIQATENSIGGISTDEAADGIGIAAGIQNVNSTAVTSGGITNALIARNRINGVAATSTTGFSAVGIALAGDITANTIQNNMVTGVTAPSTSPDFVAGIFVAGVVGSNTKLYHNSVSNTGARGAVASQIGSFGLAVSGSDPLLELKNNIFYTTQTLAGGATAKSYAIGLNYSTFANLDSNYNDFWSTGAQDGGFRTGSIDTAGTDTAALAGWQTLVLDDTNSQEADPLFVDPLTDLHLVAGPAINLMLGAGLTTGGVTNDIDNDPRPSSGPDIGADEVVQAEAGVVPAGSFYNARFQAGNTLAGNVNVSNTLYLGGGGPTNVGASTVGIGCNATVVGADASNYIIGNVRKDFCGTGTFSFPVGTTPNGSARLSDAEKEATAEGFTGEYSPAVITINSGTFPSSLTINVVDTWLPGLGQTSSTSRYWNVTETGTLNADMQFQYLNEDVYGNEPAYNVFKYDGTFTTQQPGSVNAALNQFTATGVTTFSGWAAGVLAPTAASADISGRVLTADGRPIANVRVVLAGGPLEESISVYTGHLGYYSFNDLPVGQNYVLTVKSRRFQFTDPSRVVTLNEDLVGFDFMAQPQQ